MKRWLALVCIITLIFGSAGITGCGGVKEIEATDEKGEELSPEEQEKVMKEQMNKMFDNMPKDQAEKMKQRMNR